MQNKDIKGAVLDVNTYVVQEILKDNLLDQRNIKLGLLWKIQ